MGDWMDTPWTVVTTGAPAELKKIFEKLGQMDDVCGVFCILESDGHQHLAQRQVLLPPQREYKIVKIQKSVGNLHETIFS